MRQIVHFEPVVSSPVYQKYEKSNETFAVLLKLFMVSVKYPGPQRSKMEAFATIVNGYKPSIIASKFLIHVSPSILVHFSPYLAAFRYSQTFADKSLE